MARSLASASSQYLVYGGAVRTAPPFTVSAWVYPLQADAACTILCITDYTAPSGRYHVYVNASAKAGIGVQNDGGGASQFTSTVNSYTANAWHHVVGVFAGNASRTIYLNADTANKGTGATSVTPDPGLDRTTIGTRLHSSTTNDNFNGYVANVAIWGAALSDSDVVRLYNSGIGLDPRSVRPDAMVAYWPLINGDGDQDYWGNFHLTASGSPTYAQHPPVLMRSRPKYVILGSAAPSIATIEIAGTRQVGNTLTCNATSSPSGATFAYQWYMADNILGTNQTAISGATSQTYELSYANIGAATKLYEGLDANGEAFIACGATPTKDAVEGDETVSSYVSITEAAATAPVGSPFESAYIR